jgi:hypothetical protein
MLNDHVKMGGGSPGPNPDVVTSDVGEAFERLETVLHDNDYGEFLIYEDNDLVHQAYNF